jgi:hypothetical protein
VGARVDGGVNDGSTCRAELLWWKIEFNGLVVSVEEHDEEIIFDELAALVAIRDALAIEVDRDRLSESRIPVLFVHLRAVGFGYLLNHLGVLMQLAHPCSNETSSDRPGQSEDLPGRELSGRLDSAFGVSDFRLRCSQPRLASCGNSVQSLALRACRGQRVLRVTDAQEPSDKRAADNDPVRSRGATVIVERDKDGNASGAEKINFTEVEDQARCLPNEPVGVVVEAVDVGRVDVTSNPHNGHLVSAISAHLGAVAIDGAAAGVGREATGTGVRRERSDHQ